MLEYEKLLDSKIVVVDDDASNLLFVEMLLESANYSRVASYRSADEALKAIEDDEPDLLLVDLHMPGIDGYGVLEKLRLRYSEKNTFLPVLIFTGDATIEARRRALDLGASDFLNKPGDNDEILLKVRNFLYTRHLHVQLENHNLLLERRVRQRTFELEKSQEEIARRLALAAEYRDDDTGNHAHRVGELAADIAAVLGMDADFVDLIRLAAPLHDLGKIAIPDAILLSQGSLLPSEFETMKKHTIIGGTILANSNSKLLRLAETIALTHHERWDGKGYPFRMEGEEIPLPSRIVAVADAFDAITHARPYKLAQPVDKAIRELQRCAGAHFDPKVVEALVSVIESRGSEQAA